VSDSPFTITQDSAKEIVSAVSCCLSLMMQFLLVSALVG